MLHVTHYAIRQYVCIYLSVCPLKTRERLGRLSPIVRVALGRPGDGIRRKKVGVGATINNFMARRPIGYLSTWLLVRDFRGRIFP